MSEIGWIDFSSTDRERVSQILAMLSEPGTLDELGIGQLRDAFSDSLFPGFSTIQTRARYLITVPQIIHDYFQLTAKERARTSLEIYLRDAENNLAIQLVANHKNQTEEELGIIGRTLVTKGGAARRPSSIYWNGLRQLGLIRTKKSLTEFCRQFNGNWQASLQNDLHEEGNDAPDSDRIRNVVRVGPEYREDWLQKANVKLSGSEGIFLRDQIRNAEAIKDSVPAQLIEHGLLIEALGENYNTFPQLADWLKQEENISDPCRNILALAREFGLVMEGAQIRLDCLIAKRMESQELIGTFEENYANWRERLDREKWLRPDAPDHWLNFAAGNVRIKSLSKVFVKSWNSMLIENRPLKDLDSLVEKQAIDNKKDRSILKRSLDSQFYEPGSHTLQFRWLQARRILGDVQEGLSC